MIKKLITTLTLVLGLSLSTIGIMHAYAGEPTANYKNADYNFRFLKGNPYDETKSRTKFTDSYYYMFNTENLMKLGQDLAEKMFQAGTIIQ